MQNEEQFINDLGEDKELRELFGDEIIRRECKETKEVKNEKRK